MSKQEQLETATVDDVVNPEEQIKSRENEGEPTQTSDEDNSAESKIAELEKQLAALQQENNDYYNRMLRTQADFENFRRRSRQEFEQLCLYSGEELLKKILPVLDSLERAVACFESLTGNKANWQEGVELTLRQFQNILATEGMEEVPAVNQPFDPQCHEAVLQEESDTVECPTVVELMQKGYKYKGKLIRPALVKVAVPKQ